MRKILLVALLLSFKADTNHEEREQTILKEENVCSGWILYVSAGGIAFRVHAFKLRRF